MAAPLINGQTKVGELLDAYPHLEEILVALSPAFAKLKNPILRRTVARIATLEQAARMAGLSPPDLVARLRAAAGQSAVPGETAAEDAWAPAGPAPPWVAAGNVIETIDADAMLEASQHPLGYLAGRVRALKPGDLLCVRSSFPPVPLLETLARSGVEGFIAEEGAGRFATYLRASATDHH